MHSPSRLGSPRVLALSVGSVLGLATVGQAFTLIPLNTVEKMSIGFPTAADGPSDTANRPRYTVSDDGCFAVFTSSARNLTPTQADGNGETDVFLYESCGTYKVTLVSHVAGDPDKAATGRSDQPVLSPDGRFVVFRSTAPDIVPERIADGSYQGQTNVFVWTSDTFWLASHKNGDDQEPGDRDSQNGVISRGTGQRYVAFESLANDLVDTQAADISEVFRYALGSGGAPVDLVSVPNLGLPPPPTANGGSFNPAISGPGLCIVYESEATNLVSDKASDDTNGARDVFRWGDPRSTILLSHQAGAPLVTGDGASIEPSIDDICERFAFKSAAQNLAPSQNDGNGGTDVFHAGNSGDAVLVSHRDGSATDAGSDPSDSPILSRGGNWVAYASLAKDLSPGQSDTGTPSSDVFVYDVVGGKNTLVSHTAADPRPVGSGESFAPEISIDGLYVAYESDAKDLDPNQNDGNGARDVFLYNTRWNNSIVASMRYASIAITGNGRSYRPALSGLGYAVAFTGQSSDHVADDAETSVVEDVFLFKASPFLSLMSVRSTNDRNTIEWIMPPVDYASMQAFVSTGATCPTQFSGAGTALGVGSPPANTSALFTDPTAYVPGTTRCYSIFVQRDGAAAILPGDSPAHTITARTVDDSTGAVKWASNLSEFSALTQVGIGTQNLIAVANEGGVYGLTRGPTGGFWPATYRPFRASFSPIQGRPPILPLSVLGSTRTTFVGSQDGRAYALDADRGGRAGGALWYTSPALGSVVQPGVSGMFTSFGGIGSHLVIGARSGAAPAQFFALDPATGSPRVGSPFTGGGFSIGAVNTSAAVDYTLSQVYFTSLEFTAGQPSLWCLELDAAGFGPPCWPPQTLPFGISGGPVQRNGRVYVGDDAGQVWAFDATSGALQWPGPFASCGGGAAIKSFVLADRQSPAQDLYYSAGPFLCGVIDQGATAIAKWAGPVTTVPSPSAPILARIGGIAYIYVGSSNGRLYQIEAANPFAPGAIKNVLLRPSSTIGPPAFDVFDNMIYAGSDAGAIYAVQAPLP